MSTMHKYTYFMAIAITFLTITGCTACSSQALSQSQTEMAEIQEEQPGTPETQEEQTEASEGAEGEPASKQIGWDSPEDAIKAYLAGMRDGDLKYMLNTFAAEGYIDYVLRKESTQTDSPVQNAPTPDADIIRSRAIENREDMIAEDIFRQYMILQGLQAEAHKQGAFNENREGSPEQMLEQIEETDLKSMEILGFVSQELLIEEAGSDAYQNYMDKTAENFGAEKVEGRECIIELDGGKYGLIFETAEYDGRWYNMRLGGFFAHMRDMDVKAAGTMKMDAGDEHLYEQEYDKLMVPAGTLPKALETAGFEHPSQVYEGKGFDAPHMAVKEYLEGLKENDFNRVRGAFAVESYVDYSYFQAELEYEGVDAMLQSNLSPAGYLFRELAIRSRKKQISEEAAKQYSALILISGDYYGNAPILEQEGNWQDGMESMAEALELESMNILGYVSPEDLTETYAPEAIKKQLDKQAERYGGDEVEIGIVVFELGGSPYILCADMINYNGKWRILELGGHMGQYLSLDYDLMGTMPLGEQEKIALEAVIVSME